MGLILINQWRNGCFRDQRHLEIAKHPDNGREQYDQQEGNQHARSSRVSVTQSVHDFDDILQLLPRTKIMRKEGISWQRVQRKKRNFVMTVLRGAARKARSGLAEVACFGSVNQSCKTVT